MIELINQILSLDDFFKQSENIDIAKGKYQLNTSLTKAWKQRNR